MNNGKARSSLMGIVGGYLIYLAYQLFEARGDTGTTMTPASRIVFIVLFVAAGAALLVYALRLWRQSEKEEEQQEPKDDENSLR